MDIQPILLPGLAMVALTFVVMAVMYRRRVAQMLRERIHPQAVATSTQAAARLTDCTAADNFRNLFELPVLFYFALLTAALTGQATATVQALAWSFVALRIAHSAIHCGYNKVMHRFRVYALGALVLLVLWLRLAWGLLAA
ncbi:MAPEG family protein [Luteimonas sp. RD2P54]|uniref:MAPEG family protein n=1 Tax=Luteimonas endophytica TaxID=3042023 RepID=A0ABT6JC09_9GAMM|nr:MAPEG family protein [Luteimonas endophytica]MDH5824364.1 MAPEG family protein [Luteimonas endophytica]